VTDTANPARPMTAADYRDGQPVAIAAAHPTRDLVVAAIVGAVALWAVPKVLDRWAGGFFDEPDDEYELDVESLP